MKQERGRKQQKKRPEEWRPNFKAHTSCKKQNQREESDKDPRSLHPENWITDPRKGNEEKVKAVPQVRRNLADDRIVQPRERRSEDSARARAGINLGVPKMVKNIGIRKFIDAKM